MLESSYSLSVPSEPPRIGNWFSSYAYESPVANSIDDLEVDSGEGKTCKEEKFVKRSSGENAASDGDDECAIEFLRSSENQALSDIKDSFDSYVPETPTHDQNGDLSIPEGNFKEDTRQGATDGCLSKGLLRCNNCVEALNHSNQVMNSSDYLSLSPEPANIDDCLDSYVPETQAFDECNDSRVPESNENALNDYGSQRGLNSSLGKAEDQKCARNGTKEKSAVQLSEASVKFETSKGNYKNLSQNLLSSVDIALTSEPPDIKNWFSSYVYESPTLESSNDGFSLSLYEESEFDVEENNHAGQRKLQNLSSTKVFFANDKKENNYQPSPKKGHDSARNTQNKRIKIHDYISAEDFVASLDGKSSAEKLDTTLPGEAGLKLSDANICSPSKHENPSLIQRWDSAEHNLVLSSDNMQTAGALSPTFSLNTSAMTGKSSQMEHGGRHSKENDGNGFAENDFISTRKIRSKKLHDENSSGFLRSATADKSTCHKDTAAGRVLLDTTNIHQNQPPDSSQITGKWQCPQKRKPQLGPPLKQLRLEQWIRRV